MVTIEFPTGWTNAPKLEKILFASPGPHTCSEVTFRFCNDSKLMIDAIVRLLSLLNQLDCCARRVIVTFDDGMDGVMGYLNRMGFFDHLASGVQVIPERPSYSGAALYGGGNPGLVEIERINHQHRDKELPARLAMALGNACSSRLEVDALTNAAWTIFTELIDNIFEHSATPLDGYAALQLYKQGKALTVAVSDSGLGIMQTLRPALLSESPALASLSDTELLVQVFRQGLSRHGDDRGCGLKGSAAKAMKYRATLDVRLPNLAVCLSPSLDGYKPNVARCSDGLPLIWGTHICFTFQT
jgi:hypothetical protein